MFIHQPTGFPPFAHRRKPLIVLAVSRQRHKTRDSQGCRLAIREIVNDLDLQRD